jgi:hypothetical protein
VAKCPQELLQDTFVDPIFNFLVNQIQLQTYPLELRRELGATETQYTFVCKDKTYLAVVDLKTNKFKVMEVQESNEVLEQQKKLGLRLANEQAKVNASSSSSDIMKYVDGDIRSKHFPNENIKMVSYRQTDTGYFIVYQKENGEQVGFDVTVQINGGNIMISYQMALQHQTQPAPQPAPQPTPAQPAQPPALGSYQQIANPLKNSDVVAVFSFLITKVNSLIQYATLISAEIQVVNGYNFRLRISFDTSSPAAY